MLGTSCGPGLGTEGDSSVGGPEQGGAQTVDCGADQQATLQSFPKLVLRSSTSCAYLAGCVSTQLGTNGHIYLFIAPARR